MLEFERNHAETLAKQDKALRAQLELITKREVELQAIASEYEKDLALRQHNYKVAMQKVEQEIEQRKKTEALLVDTQRNLDNEQKIRTREMNNNQHHNDKIVTLEKQLKEMEENFKNETENSQKLKKHAAELGLSKQELEQKVNQLQAIIASLQVQKDTLQQEVMDLQTLLAQEKNARSQLKEMQKEMENKMQTVSNDLERAMSREQQAHEDNRVLTEKISDLEKANAGLDFELKTAQSRYQQEVKAHQETEKTRMLSREEANLQEVNTYICFFKILL